MRPAGEAARRARPRLLLAALGILAVTGVLFMGVLTLRHSDRIVQPPRRSHAEASERPGFASLRELGLEEVCRDVSVRTLDGHVLRAWYFPRPEAPGGPGPAILMLHGHRSNRMSLIRLGAFFYRSGYALLLPDLRHHGTSQGADFTFGFREVGDVERLVAFLHQEGHPPGSVGGFGVSLGGYLALLSQARRALFSAVISDSASSDIRESILHHGWIYHGAPYWFSELGMQVSEWRTGMEFDDLVAREAAPAIRCPVLLIHGADDDRIPPRHSEVIAGALSGPSELLVVSGAGHAQCYDKAPALYRRRAGTFLNRYLPLHRP